VERKKEMSTPAPDTRSQLREQRATNRLLEEQIRGTRLRRAQDKLELRESFWPNWTESYADYLDRLRPEYSTFGPSAIWQRRRGANYPIYRSEQELALLRAPSRLLCQTNGYAIGMKEGLTSYVIGQGFTYRAAWAVEMSDDDMPRGLMHCCQSVINRFLADNDWHGGEMPSIEEELFDRSLEDGDAILTQYKRDDGGMDVRICEPEQLTQPPGTDPREWQFGVHTDPDDTQKPLAYWIQHGETPGEGEEYEPDELLHITRNRRRGAKRGVPDFCFETEDALRLAGVLRRNLTEGAAIQAGIVGIRQHATATPEQINRFLDEEKDFAVAAGNGKQAPVRRQVIGFEDIPEGMNYVNGPGANNAAAHIAVMEACLRGAGVRWNAPEWLSTGYAANTNYASSLTSESPFLQTVLRRQRTYRESFRRVVEQALRWAACCGQIYDASGHVWTERELMRYVRVECEAPSPISRNPLQDAQVASIEIPLGVDSRQAYSQRQGRDWTKVQKDNQQYTESTSSGGQQLPLPDGLDWGKPRTESAQTGKKTSKTKSVRS
jgi:hypothetical protein